MYGLVDMDEPGHTQPAAKPRYKVGQRVRVMKDGYGANGSLHGATAGEVLTIESVEDDDDVYAGGWFLWHDEIEPVFSPGDRVRVTACNGYFAAGDVGTVERHGKHAVFVKLGDYQRSGLPIEADKLELLTDREPVETLTIKLECDTSGFTKSLDAALGASRPHIVALVKNGKPRPAAEPFVHNSLGGATTEAERLARINPGHEFAVYQRVAGRVAEIEMKEVA